MVVYEYTRTLIIRGNTGKFLDRLIAGEEGLSKMADNDPDHDPDDSYPIEALKDASTLRSLKNKEGHHATFLRNGYIAKINNLGDYLSIQLFLDPKDGNGPPFESFQVSEYNRIAQEVHADVEETHESLDPVDFEPDEELF